MSGEGASDRAAVQRVEQLPRPDWTDQDLLTKDEAHERLVQEISRTKARLDEVKAGPGDPAQTDAELTLLARRLNAMESVRDEYNDYLDGKGVHPSSTKE